MPVQRIPRYRLLLERLFKATSVFDDAFGLIDVSTTPSPARREEIVVTRPPLIRQRALQAVARVNEELNDALSIQVRCQELAGSIPRLIQLALHTMPGE